MNAGFNIFRGQADAGMGEAPRARGANGWAARSIGEQYLHCDPELWNEAFTDEARLWLTFGERGGDRRVVGDSLQGWAAAPVGQYYLTALLRPFGLYTDRLAYFSHGRAWPLSDFRDGFDPGALLGRSNAFSAPWRDQAPVFGDPTIEPRMVWAELLQAEAAVAASLLGALLQAMNSATAVVWLVPLTDFAASSSVHGLVSFTRAALPYRMKQKCRIRVYATNAERFLVNGGAHLIVCPEDMRLESQSAPSKQVVLDRSGRVMAGTVDSNYQIYANQVIPRAQKFPDGLFRFSVRADTLARVEATAVAYDLAYAAEAGRTDELLRSLYRLASSRENGFPWGSLIWESDWKKCNPATLKSLAFEKAPTSDARELRGCIRNALGHIHQQRVDFAHALVYLNDIDQSQCAFEIDELKRSGLIDEGTAQKLSDQIITPAQLLEIFKEPEGIAQVASLSGTRELPETWTRGVYDKIPVSQLLEVLGQGAVGWIPALVLRMRMEVRNPNYAVPKAAAIAGYCGRSNDVHDWIVGAELLSRAKLPNDALLDKVWSVREAKERSKAMDLANETWATCLREGRIPPADWDADVGNRLLANPSMTIGLASERLARLAAQITEEWPPHVMERLSWFMASDPGGTTRVLQQSNIWLKWRLTSGSMQGDRRALGWWWMKAAGELRRSGIEPRMEEWEQALLDIGEIQGSELVEWCRHGLAWPYIRLLWINQLQGLVGRCVFDPGVFCELAISTGKDNFELVANKAGLDPEWLRALSQESTPNPLSLESAEQLFQQTKHRKDNARRAFTGSILHVLPSSGETIDVVIRHDFWAQIAKGLEDLLARKKVSNAVMTRLEKELTADASPLLNPELAEKYRRVVELLGLGTVHKPLVKSLVAAVLEGHESGWRVLAGRRAADRSTILAQVDQSLREVSPWGDREKEFAARVFEFAAGDSGLNLKEIAELARSILQGFSRAEMAILTRRNCPADTWSDSLSDWQIILNRLEMAGSDRILDSVYRIRRYLVATADDDEVRAFEQVAVAYQ